MAVFSGLIGIERADITPPVGISVRNWGAAAHEVAEGVHRPLTLTAVVFSQPDEAPLALIGLDLGVWRSPDDEWLVRGAIVEAVGGDPARVIVALSHTHSGPSLYREDPSQPGSHRIAPYLSMVRARALAAMQNALKNRVPATVSWRYGRCDLAKNRELPAADGKRCLVGYNPDAAADDTLLVGRIERDSDRAIIGVIVNYACHPTTLAWENRLLSPDFPGAMRELVERETGARCLFLQGASGDLAPAHQYVGDVAVADRHGRRLGHAVLALLESWSESHLAFSGVLESGAPLALMTEKSPPTSVVLKAALATHELALKPLPLLAELDRAWSDSPPGAMRERLWRQRALRRRLGDGRSAPGAVWAWRLGEAMVFAQPNEMYSCAQIELREAFASRPLVVLNLANGCSSYLPPRAVYQGDCYAANISAYASGGLETVIQSAVGLGRELLLP
jgi:hypothetical protein